MDAFTKHSGIVVPLDVLNVDTDQIVPKQFLKRIERTGYEDCLFYDWRYVEDGSPDPQFEMNAARYTGASILLARDNFGCGSSREHAPWALHNYGFRAILAPSFADIFYNNCFNNGLLPIVLESDVIQTLFDEVRDIEGYAHHVSLVDKKIEKPDGSTIEFDLDPFLRERLLNGWDHIDLTMRHEDKITAFENARAK